MDEQTARAVELLYEASVEVQRALASLTRIADDQHQVIDALHDIVLETKRLRVVS